MPRKATPAVSARKSRSKSPAAAVAAPAGRKAETPKAKHSSVEAASPAKQGPADDDDVVDEDVEAFIDFVCVWMHFWAPRAKGRLIRFMQHCGCVLLSRVWGARLTSTIECISTHSDWATKLVLRILYAVQFAFGIAYLLFPHDALSKYIAINANMPLLHQRIVGALFVGHGSLLAAAAQLGARAQKKMLQYNMVELLVLGSVLLVHQHETGGAAYAYLAAQAVFMLLSLWCARLSARGPVLTRRCVTQCVSLTYRACYVWKEKRDEEEEE